MKEFMLSLASNPYDPFEQYGLWKQFDSHEGFDTDGFLARVLDDVDSLSSDMHEADVEAAIDSIINNPSFKGLYKKVTRLV